jgi:ArsR family transcriptional regulator, arsenate/arsenite/antimonite-responsive transcriptional repressor
MPMVDQCLKEKGRNSAGHAAKKTNYARRWPGSKRPQTPFNRESRKRFLTPLERIGADPEENSLTTFSASANYSTTTPKRIRLMARGRGEKELQDLEVVFKALAHASRRHVLVVLNARGGSMTAGEIARRFSCSWPTTSRHLRVLVDAGLVRVDKCGREWIYVLEADRIRRVVGGWVDWFESPQEKKGNQQ